MTCCTHAHFCACTMDSLYNAEQSSAEPSRLWYFAHRILKFHVHRPFIIHKTKKGSRESWSPQRECWRCPLLLTSPHLTIRPPSAPHSDTTGKTLLLLLLLLLLPLRTPRGLQTKVAAEGGQASGAASSRSRERVLVNLDAPDLSCISRASFDPNPSSSPRSLLAMHRRLLPLSVLRYQPSL